MQLNTNVQSKCIIFGEAPKKLGAKHLNKFFLKLVQKALQWPLQYVDFQKISGELALGSFSVCFKSIMSEKMHMKKSRNLVSPP